MTVTWTRVAGFHLRLKPNFSTRRGLRRAGALAFGMLTVAALSGGVGAQFRRVVTIDHETLGETSQDSALGAAVTALGDLNGDGVLDLAIGEPGADETGINDGAIRILLMNSDGSVLSHTRISAQSGGFTDTIGQDWGFGDALFGPGDIDGDGTVDLFVGAPNARGGRGLVWTLLLAANGTVKSWRRIENPLSNGSRGRMGASITSPGDVNQDGVPDLIASIDHTLTGRGDGGLVTFLLGSDGAPLSTDGAHITLSQIEAAWGAPLRTDFGIATNFGASLTAAGDQDGDGIPDIVVGSGGLTFDPPSGRCNYDVGDPICPPHGGLFYLNLGADGSMKSFELAVPGTTPAFADRGVLQVGFQTLFMGDLDANGANDFVFQTADDDSLRAVRQVWIAYSGDDGQPGDITRLDQSLLPAHALSGPFDLDGDRAQDLLIGSDNRVHLAFGVPGPSSSIQIFEPEVQIDQPAAFRALIGGSLRGADVIDAAALSFRRSGDQNFFSIPFERGGDDEWRTTIPAFVVSDRGIDYFVSARDAFGSELRDPVAGFHSLEVFLPGGFVRPVPFGDLADGFRILTIPANLAGASADSIFFDDLGSYDPTLWRLYGETELLIREYGAVSLDLSPGKGFWLLGRETDRSFTTGPGTTVPTATPFKVKMKPGWNLVGNPYTFTLSNAQVVSADRLEHPEDGPIDVHKYDGAWSALSGPWEPFEGYALFNFSGLVDTLLFYSDPATIPETKAAKREEEIDWAIRISATKGRARDTDNVALLAPGASSGWDRLDRAEPPVIGDYVSVSFGGDRWRLSTDARPSAIGWPLIVRTSTPGVVNLSFEVPDGVSAYVFDPASGTTHDLRANSAFQVASPGGGVERRFELRVRESPPEFVPGPFSLYPVFPNPSSGAVTLSFQLPERTEIELEIFDVLGRKLATLATGPRMPGKHALVWDGSDLSPGLYLSVLKAGGRTVSTPLTIAR